MLPEKLQLEGVCLSRALNICAAIKPTRKKAIKRIL